jgi:hypothetical protein
MNEVGELDGVSDKEDGSVVADHVVDSFLRVELECEASWVSGNIGRSLLSGDSRESSEDWCYLSYRIEELGLGVFRHILRHLEVSVRSSSNSMDHSLWDSL